MDLISIFFAFSTIVAETGWTDFKPSIDSRVIYVSSSIGNDANDGKSEAKPVKTQAKAKSLTRAGFPDWILFKRGDIFVGAALGNSGRSASERFLLGAYGDASLPRPIFNVAINEKPVDGCGSNKNIVSLRFVASKRNPYSSTFNLATASTAAQEDGVSCGTQYASDIRYEDCEFDFFRTHVAYTSAGGVHKNLVFFRNIFNNSWAAYSNPSNTDQRKSMGLFISKATNVTLQENIFYKNGWSDKIPTAPRSIMNHSIYTYNIANFVVAGNITALSSGLAFKIAGTPGSNPASTVTLDNNFIIRPASDVAIHNNDKLGNSHKSIVAMNNVSTHVGAEACYRGTCGNRYGQGMVLNDSTSAAASGNLFVDKSYSSMGGSVLSLINDSSKSTSKNTVFKFTTNIGGAISPANSTNVVEPAAIKLVDPSRTIDTYMGVSAGMGEAAFYAGILKQRKGAYDPKFTAPIVNDWFRSGIKLK